MNVFALALGFLLGNNYVECDQTTVYLHSETVVVNDKLKTERIISVKEGLKPLTYELLWVENDDIVLNFHN